MTDRLLSMRRLYHPVQPAVQQYERDVQYREIEPIPYLQGLILCYWELKTNLPLEAPFFYNVAADGCIDIFFEPAQPNENFVMGFSTAYTRFPLGCSFHYVGIRFLPMAFPQMFRIDASELTNTVEHLDSISPSVSKFIASRFDESVPLHLIKEYLDSYFLKHIGNREMDPDSRLLTAIEIILKGRGNIRIEKELNTGMSTRQLRRLFNRHLGGSTKTFSRVVRFQCILKKIALRGQSGFSSALDDAGYYDQAHFIKECKLFYGTTPAGICPKAQGWSG